MEKGDGWGETEGNRGGVGIDADEKRERDKRMKKGESEKGRRGKVGNGERLVRVTEKLLYISEISKT